MSNHMALVRNIAANKAANRGMFVQAGATRIDPERSSPSSTEHFHA